MIADLKKGEDPEVKEDAYSVALEKIRSSVHQGMSELERAVESSSNWSENDRRLIRHGRRWVDRWRGL